jgi:hypothetical protein
VGVVVSKMEDTRKRKKKPVARALKYAKALKEPSAPEKATEKPTAQESKGG